MTIRLAILLAILPPTFDPDVELRRWPSYERTGDVCQFIMRHERWVKTQKLPCGVSKEDYLFELAKTKAPWLVLYEAHVAGLVARKQALKRLREEIGEGAWQAGVMPPPVPVWLWQR